MSKSPRGGPRIGNTCQCRPNHLLGVVRVSIMDIEDKGMSCDFACLSCASFVFSSFFGVGGLWGWVVVSTYRWDSKN